MQITHKGRKLGGFRETPAWRGRQTHPQGGKNWGCHGNPGGTHRFPRSRRRSPLLDHWCPGACGTFRTDPFFVIFLIGRLLCRLRAEGAGISCRKKSVKNPVFFGTPKLRAGGARLRAGGARKSPTPPFFDQKNPRRDPRRTPSRPPFRPPLPTPKPGVQRGPTGTFFAKSEKTERNEPNLSQSLEF